LHGCQFLRRKRIRKSPLYPYDTFYRPGGAGGRRFSFGISIPARLDGPTETATGPNRTQSQGIQQAVDAVPFSLFDNVGKAIAEIGPQAPQRLARLSVQGRERKGMGKVLSPFHP